jgi:hypothetical protein
VEQKLQHSVLVAGMVSLSGDRFNDGDAKIPRTKISVSFVQTTRSSLFQFLFLGRKLGTTMVPCARRAGVVPGHTVM